MRAAAGGDSIDNLIDQADDDPLVAQVGKLAIALQILRAERESKLAIAINDNIFDLEAFNNTWLYGFIRLLRIDTKRSMLEDIFERVSVITLNYDRTLEFFLPLALQQTYDLDLDDAAHYAAKLRIFHPYGMVGVARGPHSTPFGNLQPNDIQAIAKNLVTFGERVEQNAGIVGIRDQVSRARHVVFLGFGFHRQNMKLITPDSNRVRKRFFGTTLGLSSAAQKEVSQMVENIARAGGSLSSESLSLPNISCTDLLEDYSIPLTG